MHFEEDIFLKKTRQRSRCKVEARASLTGSDGQIVPSYFACVVTYLDAHLSPSCQPACKDGQMHLITCKPDNYFPHQTRLQSPFHPRCCHMIIFLAHLCYTFLIIMINLIVMITKTFFNRMWKYQSNIIILSIYSWYCHMILWTGFHSCGWDWCWYIPWKLRKKSFSE